MSITLEVGDEDTGTRVAGGTMGFLRPSCGMDVLGHVAFIRVGLPRDAGAGSLHPFFSCLLHRSYFEQLGC